jgi:hypothetical protein
MEVNYTNCHHFSLTSCGLFYSSATLLILVTLSLEPKLKYINFSDAKCSDNLQQDALKKADKLI